jgi:hypothetical protein
MWLAWRAALTLREPTFFRPLTATFFPIRSLGEVIGLLLRTRTAL